MARSIGLLKKLVAVPLLKKSVAVLLSLLAVALGIAGCGSSSPGVPAVTQGVSSTAGSAATNGGDVAPAPEVSGVTLAGTEVSSNEYRGRPLVLAFMASW